MITERWGVNLAFGLLATPTITTIVSAALVGNSPLTSLHFGFYRNYHFSRLNCSISVVSRLR
jgi:hypothetical protein